MSDREFHIRGKEQGIRPEPLSSTVTESETYNDIEAEVNRGVYLEMHLPCGHYSSTAGHSINTIQRPWNNKYANINHGRQVAADDRRATPLEGKD